MPTDTFCSDTFYVHTDPGSLPSFAEECSFGNRLRIHTTKKMQLRCFLAQSCLTILMTLFLLKIVLGTFLVP